MLNDEPGSEPNCRNFEHLFGRMVKTTKIQAKTVLINYENIFLAAVYQLIFIQISSKIYE